MKISGSATGWEVVENIEEPKICVFFYSDTDTDSDSDTYSEFISTLSVLLEFGFSPNSRSMSERTFGLTPLMLLSSMLVLDGEKREGEGEGERSERANPKIATSTHIHPHPLTHTLFFQLASFCSFFIIKNAPRFARRRRKRKSEQHA